MIGLVACCATKLDRPAPARHLYCSPLFRASLTYAELCCGRVYVLSARHGLVELDTMIAPYEQRIAGHRLDRRRWARVVTDELEARHGREVELLVLAGREYAEPLIARVAYWWPGARIVTPLERLQLGERLRWLGEQSGRCAA